MGVTKSGNFAVLTNYKEDNNANQPIQGQRSRGGMVTAWLTAAEEESTHDFVRRLMAGEGVKGVGGFSLLCGKLRKLQVGCTTDNITPFAIISNRAGSIEDVPWIGSRRDEIHGLSNTFFDDPVEWPKIKKGKEQLRILIDKAIATEWSQEKLLTHLFDLLDDDTLPPKQEEESFEQYTYQLRKSIFIPPFGHSRAQLPSAEKIATAKPDVDNVSDESKSRTENVQKRTPAPMTGVYGTQRQTVMLVNRSGKVVFIERALWDNEGKPIEKGLADEKIEFSIEGW